MSEADIAGALQAEIDAAQLSGNTALADELYQRQVGSTDLARSRERAEPAPLVQAEAEDEGQAEAPGPHPSDIENMGGSRLADYRPYDALSEDERGQEFDRVFSLADSEVSRGILQAEWSGADFDRNLAFGEAALASIPGSLDVLRILEVVGLADHPDLIRWIASAGRLMASKPGDPTSMPTLRKGTQTMDSTIEARFRELDNRMDKARAEFDRGEMARIYQEQLALQRQLPGGSDPAVGSSGGPTA